MSRGKKTKKLEKTYSKLVRSSFYLFLAEVALIAAYVLLFIFNPAFLPLKTWNSNGNLFPLVTILILISLINAIYVLVILGKVVKNRSESDLLSAELFGAGVDEAYKHGKIGLIVVDKDKDDFVIIWANSFMMNRHSQAPGLINSDIRKVFPGISVDSSEESEIKIGNYTYRVRYLSDSGLFILCDNTDYRDLRNRYEKEAVVLGLVRIDNYGTDLRLRGNISLMSDIKHLIATYFESYNVYLIQTAEDSFTITCDVDSLERMKANQFSILDKAKEINTDSSSYITLSIGIASGIPNITKLKGMSSDALKEALTRGGDQVVISEFGKNTVFIGGKTLSKASQNNANTRDEANKILKFIEDSDHIFIMGHKATDLDAFGSALGLYLMCQHKGKHAYVVFDKSLSGSDVRNVVANDFGLTNDILISPKDAVKIAKEKSNSLVIVTDVSSREMVICTELLDIYQIKILIVDHHQPGANQKRIENPIASYIDPSASSCSEIVANYLHYATANPRIDVNPLFATIMLSGILLDTDSYRRDTTSPSTYEASMFLRENGADNQKAAKLVFGSKEEFVMLNRYLAETETLAPGVTYIKVDLGDGSGVTDEFLAKLSDNLIRIRDVRAGFAIGKILLSNGKSMIKCSARSDGTINVGKLMSYFKKGGGRFPAAAAIWTEETLKEAEKELLKVIRDHLDECRYNGKMED